MQIPTESGSELDANQQLIYCALAESIFSKILHTPHGLSLTDIAQVKAAQDSGGVKSGWIRCVELALRQVDAQRSGYLPNVRKKLNGLIEAYIFDPSLIRNKLAHGQWCVALNREATGINADLTAEIGSLDVVELYRRRMALDSLSAIVEDIVESPNRAHLRDYWIRLTDFQQRAEAMGRWTLQAKIAALKEKSAHRILTS